ncbi:MAG TPA: hypothetical protein VFG81_14230 [Anaerolineales bacterium]|nr:hypothetical protein [Anaerolineales bacterium]
MARKRRKAPRILLHPMFRWIRGRMGKIVYRLSHNGEVSAYPAPDMSHIEWSPAQQAQRQRMARATAYAKLAIQYPDIRQFYVEMAKQRKRNEGRPFDMAVSDYCQGNDLLWQKLYGDQQKPSDWSWQDAEGGQLPPLART